MSKIINQYGWDEFNDDMFRSFQKGLANYRLDLAKDEALYFENLGELVQQSRGYNNSQITEYQTDWQYAEQELDEASNIYCADGLNSCYDSENPQGKLIGLLNTAFQKNKSIFNASQKWIKEFSEEGGWSDRIRKFQKSYDGKDGTQGIDSILTEIAEFRKAKDGVLSEYAIRELEEKKTELSNWIDVATFIGEFDQDPADPSLNFMLPPQVYLKGEAGQPQPGEDKQSYSDRINNYINRYTQEAQLTMAVENLRSGFTKKASQHHDAYMRGIDDRHNLMLANMLQEEKDKQNAIDAAIADKERALAEYDDRFLSTIAAGLNPLEMNLKGSKGLDYDLRFKDATKYYLEGDKLKKGSLTLKTLPVFKRGLARNLANYMNLYSEGDAEISWKEDVARMKEIFPNLSESEQLTKAVDAYFGPMTETKVYKLTQGETGLFQDWGMDFPGWKGWFDLGNEKEANAEEYMNAQVRVWKILYDMEHDKRFSNQNLPQGGAYDPMGMMNTSQSNIQSTSNQNNQVNKDAIKNLSALSASDSVGTPVDSLLNIQDPTQNYAPSPGDSSMRDVLEKLANAGFTDDQIIGMRQATMESMSKDGFEFPEKIWHKAAEDYLNYKHLYTDYNDYLDSLHTKEDK